MLNFEDAGNRAAEKLEDIDLSLAWPSISRSFAATGQFDWRGERVDGSIGISDFVAALSGDRSGLKARLSARERRFRAVCAESTGQRCRRVDCAHQCQCRA